MNKTQVYLPKVRTDYYPKEKDLRSFAPDGSLTKIPNPAVDSIAVNNIAWQEFDYTESMADDYEEYNIIPDNKIEGDK